MKKKLFIVLLIIFVLHLGFRIFQYSGEYLYRYDVKYWEDRYLRSQWVVADTKESIGDDGLYAYVGYEYITGRDPTTLNAELPPLGKYLIGLSILIFGNQNIFALLSGVFVLISLFFLGKVIFKNNVLAFSPVFLLSVDPLFYTQLRAPFLDLLYLGFLLLTFLFFLKERFILSAVFLGCMMATKASASTFVLVAFSMAAYLFYMRHTDQIKKFIFSLSASIGVFLLTYIVYFFNGHGPIEFLGVQKWILSFYTGGAQGDPSSALQMLLMGNWPTWWGETLRVTEWNLLWPISLLAAAYYFYKVFPTRKLYPSVLFAIWIAVYLIFLAVIPTWPRYLLLLLPFMYTLSVWVFTKSRVTSQKS